TEDWDVLRGIRIQGTAEIIGEGDEYVTTKRLLIEKFPQFKTLGWKDGVHVIMKIVPNKATSWGI
ncbi:MAG: hypothetical protein O2854_09295, partial [Chloroflexi bacterium]|nr:hypothetical protein [Chloroflexota bacterium]